MKTLTLSRFQRLADVADAQGVVLQKESKVYSLYSNRTFTGTDCADLDEVAYVLAFDPSFGALELPPIQD